MTQMSKLYSHAAVILQVPDLEATLKYYVDQLELDVSFKWGDPIEYAVGKLGENVQIHFAENDTSEPFKTALYIFVTDVNEVYASLKNKGVDITSDIADREYGMRDFDITDINGNRLTFATGLDLINS